MKVEMAKQNDIDELVKLRLAYLNEDIGPLEEAEVRIIQAALPDYYRRHLHKDLLVYVIRNSQAIVSCAFLLIVEKPMSPSFPNGRTGTVMNVYTIPASRRQGYAGEIMRALLADAKAREISVIDLKATDDGYPLYRSAGFAEDKSKYRTMKWINFKTGS